MPSSGALPFFALMTDAVLYILLCMQSLLPGASSGALDDAQSSLRHDNITCIIVCPPSPFQWCWPQYTLGRGRLTSEDLRGVMLASTGQGCWGSSGFKGQVFPGPQLHKVRLCLVSHGMDVRALRVEPSAVLPHQAHIPQHGPCIAAAMHEPLLDASILVVVPLIRSCPN